MLAQDLQELPSLEKFKRMNRHAGSKPRFGFLVHLASGTTAMVTKRRDRHGNSVLEGVPRHSRQSVQWKGVIKGH